MYNTLSKKQTYCWFIHMSSISTGAWFQSIEANFISRFYHRLTKYRWFCHPIENICLSKWVNMFSKIPLQTIKIFEHLPPQPRMLDLYRHFGIFFCPIEKMDKVATYRRMSSLPGYPRIQWPKQCASSHWKANNHYIIFTWLLLPGVKFVTQKTTKSSLGGSR